MGKLKSPNNNTLASQPRATQPGHPSWVDSTYAVDGFSHLWGGNGEFCVTVGPVHTGLSMALADNLTRPSGWHGL